ncbi:hypothetical protein CYMTET_29119 [Cymbomonas tetramitiformis]|uniref:Uncharacterized protein n=1 Tax=Cymbomonas tetramitiformis TaxID=36881 RepID=A0AAE0FM28_9CHLO|nr:hypothetical protein CYMTET_29119 [Cymbomonas tetramitiformis]
MEEKVSNSSNGFVAEPIIFNQWLQEFDSSRQRPAPMLTVLGTILLGSTPFRAGPGKQPINSPEESTAEEGSFAHARVRRQRGGLAVDISWSENQLDLHSRSIRVFHFGICQIESPQSWLEKEKQRHSDNDAWRVLNRLRLRHNVKKGQWELAPIVEHLGLKEARGFWGEDLRHLHITHLDLNEANKWADRLSRDTDVNDWKLNWHWFDWAQVEWGEHTVDRFASEISAQLPRLGGYELLGPSAGWDAIMFQIPARTVADILGDTTSRTTTARRQDCLLLSEELTRSMERQRADDERAGQRGADECVEINRRSLREHWRGEAFQEFSVAEGREWLPAMEETMRLKIAALTEKGDIQATSMQPHLSAINNYHEDMGYPSRAGEGPCGVSCGKGPCGVSCGEGHGEVAGGSIDRRRRESPCLKGRGCRRSMCAQCTSEAALTLVPDDDEQLRNHTLVKRRLSIPCWWRVELLEELLKLWGVVAVVSGGAELHQPYSRAKLGDAHTATLGASLSTTRRAKNG